MFAHRRAIAYRLSLAIAAGLATGLLAACSGNGDGNGGGGGGGGGAITPTAPGGGVGTIGSIAPSDQPPAPVSYPDTAQAYAEAAVHAWSSGDNTRLGQLNDAGDTLFTTLSAGDYNKAFSLYQCNGAAGSSICVFYNQVGDEADVRLRNDLVGSAHAVVDGQFHPITFPTDYQAYAQEALNAWTNHNTAAVALLTGKPGDTGFGGVPASHRTDSWTYDHAEGAAGHQYYLFGNAAGDTVAIGFANPGFVTVPANRHGLIENVVFSPHS